MTWDNIRTLVGENKNVAKYVFENYDAVVEAVLYKYPTYAERTVICCSTQSGCPVGCRFCGTGEYFVRSLNSEEIFDQPKRLLDDVLRDEGTSASKIERLQIMFMSMGEPLLNLKNLIPAMGNLNVMYPNAALLISTSGPKVDYRPLMKIAKQINKIGLQFSVHESTNEARNKLIPFEKKLTLNGIAEQGEEFFLQTGRSPFFNYCVHPNNNSEADADRLQRRFDPKIWQATISVICERNETVAASNDRQKTLASDFRFLLAQRGFQTRVFDPAGQDDVGGGCGQLWQVQKWMREHPEQAHRSVGFELPVVHTPGGPCDLDL